MLEAVCSVKIFVISLVEFEHFRRASSGVSLATPNLTRISALSCGDIFSSAVTTYCCTDGSVDVASATAQSDVNTLVAEAGVAVALAENELCVTTAGEGIDKVSTVDSSVEKLDSSFLLCVYFKLPMLYPLLFRPDQAEGSVFFFVLDLAPSDIFAPLWLNQFMSVFKNKITPRILEN